MSVTRIYCICYCSGHLGNRYQCKWCHDKLGVNLEFGGKSTNPCAWEATVVECAETFWYAFSWWARMVRVSVPVFGCCYFSTTKVAKLHANSRGSGQAIISACGNGINHLHDSYDCDEHTKHFWFNCHFLKIWYIIP